MMDVLTVHSGVVNRATRLVSQMITVLICVSAQSISENQCLLCNVLRQIKNIIYAEVLLSLIHISILHTPYILCWNKTEKLSITKPYRFVPLQAIIILIIF